jgi:hypothetical protein
VLEADVPDDILGNRPIFFYCWFISLECFTILIIMTIIIEPEMVAFAIGVMVSWP